MKNLQPDFPFPAFQSTSHKQPLKVGEEINIRMLNGKNYSGKLAAWQLKSGFIAIDVGRSKGEEEVLKLKLDSVKFVIFPRLRPYKNELGTMPISNLISSNPGKQEFTITFTDDDKMQGQSYGYYKNQVGYYVFIDSNAGTYTNAFIPHKAVKQYDFGQRMGEILVEHNRVDKFTLDNAITTQEGQRKKRIGQYLKDHAIVTSSELGKSLEKQSKAPHKLLGQVLLEDHLITEQQLNLALEEKRQHSKEPLGQILIRLGAATREDIQFSMARKLSFPFIDLTRFEIDLDALKLVPEKLAILYNAVPVSVFDSRLIIAIEDPFNVEAFEAIQFHTKMVVEPVMATAEGIEATLSSMYAANIHELIPDALESDEEHDGDYDDEEHENLTVKIVNKIINSAIKMDASDIHIEPYGPRKKMEVRFRKDGVIQHYHSIPAKMRNPLVARLKVMAKLDISNTRTPQDGKIVFRRKTGIIELRVATIPTVSGSEDVVIRILSQLEPQPLEWLGLEPEHEKLLIENIEKPYGLFLTVGPTGSGKTTTLHSLLNHLNTVEKKIWTVEDPVELTAYGLRQIQVNNKAGLTFASIMRSILRADPDIIMLGEIRDTESAEIALEASLTGHIVLATLHTNSAPATIQRLLQMGMDAFNFGDALLGVLAQRLARRFCQHCAEEYVVDSGELSLLAEEYCSQSYGRDNVTSVIEHWQERFGNQGDIKLKRKVGCAECNDTGFSGRVGVHELLINNPVLQRAIFANEALDVLREIAVKEGMLTLKQNGILKIMKGMTDIREVRKVCL